MSVVRQVASELKKMTAFIRQEALEKAKEIHIKADEEFAIEKSKLVREETAAIDAEYERKFKQAGMSQQIARSTVANKSRIRVLAARQEVLDGMFERARAKRDAARPDADYPCRVFLLGPLHETRFEKRTPGGMMGSKQYFDVRSLAPEGAADLAAKLDRKGWSELQ